MKGEWREGSGMKRLEADIFGRVQGVYFRATARQQAGLLGLSGWVRNEPGGSVHVVAEGDEAALQEFVSFLEAGPPGARVLRVETKWQPATGEFSGFQIRR
jgi:acylphosphatase